MKKRKDRVATEEKIKAAARVLLLEEGPGAVGINALAHRAQVEKVLIYRYFKSPMGVFEALAEERQELFAAVEAQTSFAGLAEIFADHPLLKLSARMDGVPGASNPLVTRMREALDRFAGTAVGSAVTVEAAVALARAVACEGGGALADWADAQLGLRKVSPAAAFVEEELPPELL